uniref:Uncharacterized protein n=1 Tax=Human betaherpesvirus 6 TaxID=10368 RepID=A0A2R3XWW9_9BETA|nr:hypothetical protein [Human betaherpesvirus 6]QGM76890.1 hypothetical protein [Human betaherpesvirus 6]
MRHAADSPVYIGVRRRGSARALRCRFRTKHRGPSSPFNHAVVPRFYGSSPLTSFFFFYSFTEPLHHQECYCLHRIHVFFLSLRPSPSQTIKHLAVSTLTILDRG